MSEICNFERVHLQALEEVSEICNFERVHLQALEETSEICNFERVHLQALEEVSEDVFFFKVLRQICRMITARTGGAAVHSIRAEPQTRGPRQTLVARNESYIEENESSLLCGARAAPVQGSLMDMDLDAQRRADWSLHKPKQLGVQRTAIDCTAIMSGLQVDTSLRYAIAGLSVIEIVIAHIWA
ncbi:hypothetical protein J6590_073869 [Homalodisca vitripennis]|nr:hypothetical protein J6590_073869 [Homalodisca vitripennis]